MSYEGGIWPIIPFMYKVSLIAVGIGVFMLIIYIFVRKKLIKLLGISTLLAGLLYYNITHFLEFLLHELAAALAIPP